MSVRSCGVVKQGAIGWSAALCPITQCFGPEVELQLNTEVEEKRLLREQLTALEVIGHTHTCTHIYSSLSAKERKSILGA